MLREALHVLHLLVMMREQWLAELHIVRWQYGSFPVCISKSYLPAWLPSVRGHKLDGKENEKWSEQSV